MKRNDPLTYRYPRTLAEIDEERGRSWWSNAASEEAEEKRLLEQFEADDHARRMPLLKWPELLCIVLALVLLALLALGFRL